MGDFNEFIEGDAMTVQGRQGNVTFKPYRDIKTKQVKLISDNQHQNMTEAMDRVNTTVDNLYPELLCLIFSFLDTESKGRTAQVCRKWRNICNTKEIWKGCEARLHLRKLNSLVVPSLIKRGIRRVQILSIRKSLRELVTGMHTLTSLNLSGCYNLTDVGLGSMLHQDMPSLTNINLSLCKEVTDKSLGRIGSHCKNLEILELGGCTGVTNSGLLHVAQGLIKMKHLNLRSCWQLSDAGVSHLASQVGTHAGPRLLENLNLQDCQKLSDISLRYISQGLHIQTLNLSFCANISDSGMKSLARISSLKSLNLRSCDNISDIGVGYLAEGCVGLQSLDVSFCERVSDRAMVHIASGLFNLRTLSLAACKISDEGISKICKTLVDLHILNIGQCSNISDSSIEHIATRLHQLEYIDLYGCNNVTQHGIAQIQTGCPNIKRVNFNLWH